MYWICTSMYVSFPNFRPMMQADTTSELAGNQRHIAYPEQPTTTVTQTELADENTTVLPNCQHVELPAVVGDSHMCPTMLGDDDVANNSALPISQPAEHPVVAGDAQAYLTVLTDDEEVYQEVDCSTIDYVGEVKIHIKIIRCTG